MSAPPGADRITPEEIERRIRGLLPDKENSIGPVPKDALPAVAVVGIVVVAAVLGVAYLMGRRKGRRKSTFVEITRL